MIKTARLALRLRRAGIIYPLITIREARRARLPLWLLCAVLEQETGGGHNVFARYDRYRFETGRVTRWKYRRYKRERDRYAPGGRRMQGVGPMQLTWWRFQDWADNLGGCWRPRHNIRVGAGVLGKSVRELGLARGLAAYNGSTVYASEVLRREVKWRRITGVK